MTVFAIKGRTSSVLIVLLIVLASWFFFVAGCNVNYHSGDFELDEIVNHDQHSISSVMAK
jgi:hypothetical protein